MKAKLEKIWSALLKVDAENERIAVEMANLTNEFNDLVEKADQGITVIEEDDPNNSLAIKENQLDLAVFVGELESLDQVYDEYVQAKGNVMLMILASIVFVLLALSLESIFFHFNIIGSLFFPGVGILCGARWKKKQIASWIEAIKNYGNINEDIQSRSKTKKICQKLLELSNKGRELANSQKENRAKFDQLRKEFISTLEQEMEEKYREEGIDEVIEIQSATITANSVNLLSLELKGENDQK